MNCHKTEKHTIVTPVIDGITVLDLNFYGLGPAFSVAGYSDLFLAVSLKSKHGIN